MNRLALLIDLERCTGCKSCEVACKQEHGLGPGEYRNRVLWLGDDSGGLDFLLSSCQQCERPACARACPVNPKAIRKDPRSGIVAVDEDRCTGCGECVLACPYGAMGYDALDHHAIKCDLCADRRAAGEPTTACASVCPGRAIRFGERQELLRQAQSESRTTRDHDAFGLGPATLYLQRIERPGDAIERALHQRRPPALVDDPAARANLPGRRVGFPYRVPRAQRLPDRVLPGGCNICFNCCSTRFHFKGEELVRVTGNPEDPVLQGRVCPKSQMMVQLHASEHRLTRPLMRIGERGENRFRTVSWDEALDGIAARLQAIRERHGPESLAIYSGTRSGTLSNRGWLRLFSQMWGTPNVESTEPYCSSGKNVAFALTQGSGACGNSYTETDIGSAAMYLYIGDNQAETRPVYFGMVNDWRIKNGAALVVVDPRRTVTASKADRWLAIRPGTDLALALALAHHVLQVGLHDRDFCKRWVLGFERWRDFIFERGYSPRWAASITDIAQSDIEALAEQIARADGCMIMGSRGLNQHTYSTQVNRAFMYLCAITGNWGRPGGGFMNMSMPVPVAADAPHSRRTAIQARAVRKSPSGWTTAMLHGRPYPLKALISGNNPLSLWPDQTTARKALQALDLLVHMELFANETTAYADYVLPVASGIEKGEIGRQNDDRRIVWIDKMIDPPGEAKPDGWIWTELGRRLGYGDVLREELKDPARMWDEVLIDNEQMRGVTQARLHSVPWRWLRFPLASEDAPEIETLYTEGSTAPGATPGKRFDTASGMLEFWTPELERRFKAQGLSALPEFYAEREALVDLPYVEALDGDDSDGVLSQIHATATGVSRARIVEPDAQSPGRTLRAQGFDTELVTGRPPAPQFHSWTHYAWQAQEMWPDLYVQIHPSKAADLGIDDGERVLVESSHGSVEARAWITAGIRPSTVFVPIGWGERQPFHPWRPTNFLTDGQQRDPISDQTNLKSLLCRVRKL